MPRVMRLDEIVKDISGRELLEENCRWHRKIMKNF